MGVVWCACLRCRCLSLTRLLSCWRQPNGRWTLNKTRTFWAAATDNDFFSSSTCRNVRHDDDDDACASHIHKTCKGGGVRTGIVSWARFQRNACALISFGSCTCIIIGCVRSHTMKHQRYHMSYHTFLQGWLCFTSIKAPYHRVQK